MLRLMKVTVLALIAALIAFPAAALAPEWVELGEQRVKFLESDDEFAVGRDDGPFTKIRIEVNGNDLDIRYVKVRFTNGEEQTIRIDKSFREGRTSPDYDLDGNRRGIQSIFLRYNGRPLFGGTPRVKIYGERTPAPPPGPSAGLQVLDQQSFDRTSDRITFRVRRPVPVSEIRIRAVDEPLLYRNIRIVFGNGETQDVPGIERLSPGEVSRPIDLHGDRRLVDQVIIEKRPSWSQGTSRAELVGLVLPPPPPPRPQPPPTASHGFVVVSSQQLERSSDRIVFPVGTNKGRLSEIIIRAVDEPILFRNVEVVYGNDERETIEVIQRLEPGEESRPIDLKGESRFVKEVIVYKRPSWRPGLGRAELLASSTGAPTPPPAPSAGGFEVIGSTAVDRTSDRVVIRVPRGEGPFSKIKFKALDDGILFRNIQIVFSNGQTQNIDAVEHLAAGEESPPIDVEGTDRYIEQVIVTKRPSWRQGSSGLQLLGLERPRVAQPPPRPSGPPPRPAGPPSHGFPPGWVLIGAQRFTAPQDFMYEAEPIPGNRYGATRPVRVNKPQGISIPVGREVGQFDRIGLRVVGGDIQLKEVVVVYSNGQQDRLPVSSLLPDRGHTQPLPLNGDRFISEIQVGYEAPVGTQLVLEAYGNYNDNWISDRGHHREYNKGWTLLGAQRAQMFSNDLDAFQVGVRFGRFQALRFGVRQHDVRFYGLRVIYGNGDVEEVPFSGELRDGESTPPLNLNNGRGRFIERLELKYRTKLNFHGDGIVEVWGLPQ